MSSNVIQYTPKVSTQSRDDRLFCERFLDYYSRIGYLCLKYVGDWDVVRDLVQEVYLAAWKSRHNFRQDMQPSIWLGAIARNITGTYLRDRGIASISLDDLAELEQQPCWLPLQNPLETMLRYPDLSSVINIDFALSPDPEYTPESITKNGNLMAFEERLWGKNLCLVDPIGEARKVTLYLSAIFEMTNKDIAELLKIRPRTVRSRILTAHRALYKAFEPLLT